MNRKPDEVLLCALVASLFSLLAAAPAAGQSRGPDRAAAVSREKDDADRGVDRALAYLASAQKDGGHWETGKRNTVTALCLLAFLANGHTPAQNTYSTVCRKALESLIAAVPDDGYIGKTDGSRMYGQGIVTLALAEAYGMEGDLRLRRELGRKLDLLIEVILKAQAQKKHHDHQGGWRYEPHSGDSDLSLSGWCALALRSARNCGMNVPKSAVDAAADYVERMYHEGHKGFAYQRNGRVSLATTGVGVLALHLLGREDSKLVRPAAEHLAERRVERHTQWLFYTLYYTTQAANQVAGTSWGREVWETVWRNNSEFLLTHQKEDGSWERDNHAGDAGRPFSTAMAVLSLSVRNHFLPSYQR